MSAFGIIPTFDSRLRGGENIATIMNLAKAVSSTITAECRNPDGSPVRVVISNPVGGRAELAECENLFRRENVGAVLHASPNWCYAGSVIFPDKRVPQAVFGFNGTQRPGAVFEAAAISHCLDAGIRAFPIYGRDVQPISAIGKIPPDVEKKILSFVRIGLAVASMRRQNYLSIGASSMDINGSNPDPKLFRNFLDMGFQFCDMSEVGGRMRARLYDNQEFEDAMKWSTRHCKVGFDPNKSKSPHDPTMIWKQCVQMALIVMDMMRGNPRLEKLGFPEQAKGYHALLAGFQGQRNWTDYWANGDFLEAILNSAFAWYGIRMPYVIATENDALNAICMLIGFLLSGGAAQIFADLRTYWSPNSITHIGKGYRPNGKFKHGLLHLLNSGPACLDGTGEQTGADGRPTIKPWWKVTPEEAAACLKATSWHSADNVYFPGGGWSTRYLTRPGMLGTMTRLVRDETGHLTMHVLHGQTVRIDACVFRAIDKSTNPTWPSTLFVPDETANMGPYEFMNAWGANHCVLTAGHLGDLFIGVAAMLGIDIGLTNLDPSELFLPAQYGIYGDRMMTNFSSVARRLGPLYA